MTFGKTSLGRSMSRASVLLKKTALDLADCCGGAAGNYRLRGQQFDSQYDGR